MTKQQKTHAKDNGTIDEGKMTSIAESELEALLPEENPTERDYKLGEDGKRRNSEDIIGSPNRVGMMKCRSGRALRNADRHIGRTGHQCRSVQASEG